MWQRERGRRKGKLAHGEFSSANTYNAFSILNKLHIPLNEIITIQ